MTTLERKLKDAQAKHAAIILYEKRHIRFGLRVEAVLKPFAKAADRVFGTKLKGCVACKNRRDRLDRWSAKAEGWLKKLMKPGVKRRSK